LFPQPEITFKSNAELALISVNPATPILGQMEDNINLVIFAKEKMSALFWQKGR
jgi:hypothetical protein